MKFLPDILAAMSCKTATLGIIGTGSEEALIRSRAAALGISERIRFYGFLDHDGCAEVLTRCRALVLPSLSEAGGAVVLEAMAAARPVIAADHGGPADYIVAGTGWLVPLTSPQAMIAGFARQMDVLSADIGLARDTGLRARAHVVRHYDWSEKIDKMIAFYKTCLKAT